MFGPSWPDPFGPTVFGHCSSSTTDGNLQMNIHRAIAPALLALATSAHADTSPFIGTWSGWWNERAEVELAVHSVDGDGTVRGSYCVRHPRALVMHDLHPDPGRGRIQAKAEARSIRAGPPKNPDALTFRLERGASAIELSYRCGIKRSLVPSVHGPYRATTRRCRRDADPAPRSGPAPGSGRRDAVQCTAPNPVPCRGKQPASATRRSRTGPSARKSRSRRQVQSGVGYVR